MTRPFTTVTVRLGSGKPEKSRVNSSTLAEAAAGELVRAEGEAAAEEESEAAARLA